MSLQFSCGLGKKWLNAYVRHRSVATNGSNHPPGRKTLRNDRPEHSIRREQAEMFKNQPASKTFQARSSIRSESDLDRTRGVTGKSAAVLLALGGRGGINKENDRTTN